MNYVRIISLFVIISSLGAPVFADPFREALGFADSLADEGDYYRSITEYKRALYLRPDYPKAADIRLQIGRMYYLGGRFRNAKDYLIPLTDNPDPAIRLNSSRLLALTYFSGAEYVNSSRLFRDLSESEPPDRKYGTLTMAALSDGLNRNFSQAAGEFSDIVKSEFLPSDDLPYRTFLSKSEEICRQGMQLHRKNVTAAGLLGIFPGAGHVYLGEWENALVSFLSVGVTAFLSVRGFLIGDPVQGGIFATLTSGIYAGSIYSAVRQARKFNARLGDEQVSALKSEYRRLEISLSRSF